MAGNPMDSINTTKQQAFSHFNAGNLPEAQALFEQVLQMSASDIDALNLLSAIHGMSGEYQRCEYYCRRALEIHPDTTSILNNLANVLKLQGHLDDSEKYYRQVIKLEPEHPNALTNLGSLLWLKGNKTDALKYFNQTLSLDRKNPDALLNIGISLQDAGQLDEAMLHFREALAVTPNNADALYSVATVFSLQNQHVQALTYLMDTIAVNPRHAKAWSLLTSTTYQLKDIPGALEHYQKAIKFFRKALEADPDHDTARFFLSTIGEESVPTQCPGDYVASLFDDFAETFDNQLVENLEYRAPSALRAVYDEALAGGSKDKKSIVDLGCGTGLSGEAFADISKQMVGIDLSPKMLEKARLRDLYDRLIADDISHSLQILATEFELAICVDTLLYIGDLLSTLTEITKSLSAGGVFAFTVERLDEDTDYKLNTSGRYSHSQAYIKKTLNSCGMDVVHMKNGILRQEGGDPVHGHFFVARKKI